MSFLFLICEEYRRISFIEKGSICGAIECAIAARDAELGIDHDRARLIQGACTSWAV